MSADKYLSIFSPQMEARGKLWPQSRFVRKVDNAIHRINQYLICPVDSVIYFTFSLYVEPSDFSRVGPHSPRGLALFGAEATGGAYYLYQKSFARSLYLKFQIIWELESSSQASSPPSWNIQVIEERRFASFSRIIKKLRITWLRGESNASGRPAKLSVHAKSIYRSTYAKKWWQTFLVKKFFFLQSSRKHEDHSAFK